MYDAADLDQLEMIARRKMTWEVDSTTAYVSLAQIFRARYASAFPISQLIDMVVAWNACGTFSATLPQDTIDRLAEGTRAAASKMVREKKLRSYMYRGERYYEVAF